jgi:hypothetical protein
MSDRERERPEPEIPTDPRDLVPEEDGFTARSSLVILYGAFILMPANIYLLLVAGQSLITPIHFIALILWVEMCKFARKPLTTAEAFIVYSVSGVAAGQLIFYLYAINPAYFRRAEIATTAFKTIQMIPWKDVPASSWLPTGALCGLGGSPFSQQVVLGQAVFQSVLGAARAVPFSELAPTWWAPPREVIDTLPHSFFHVEWLMPIGIGVLVWICHVMADLSLGIVCRELFIRQERLPFPFAHPTADACIALTQERPDFRRIFTVTGLLGVIWGLIVYWPVAVGKKIVNYPIPWADFNAKIHTISWLRGANAGIATDILAFTGGFIVPFRVIVSMLIGGLAIQVVGNVIAVRTGLFQRFVTGMSIRTTLLNQMPVWMSVFIGGMVAAGLLQILGRPREMLEAFRGLRSTGRTAREVGGISITVLLLLFFVSVIGAVGIFKLLIPTFPVLYIVPFALVWSFVFSLIDTRAIGTTGFRVEPPYVREGLIIGADRSGARIGHAVWFAPWPIPLGASGWTQSFKVCELVRCKASSFIKAALIATPVGMLANFIFIEIFWRIADIPSATYPYADTILPIYAQNLCIWMTTTTPVINPDPTYSAASIFRPTWMLAAFGVFTLIYIANRLYAAARPGKREFLSLIGLAVGMAVPLPFSVSLFAGGVLAMLIRRQWGKEWFDRYRNVMVAGLVVGEGIVIGIAAAVAALKNSLVTIPY